MFTLSAIVLQAANIKKKNYARKQNSEWLHKKNYAKSGTQCGCIYDTLSSSLFRKHSTIYI